MSIGKHRAVPGQLRTLFHLGAVGELTDGQLLERFATDRGEAAELAFAVLVERHGPMVLRACRGLLHDPHDAQDAFQATFLVLVKRARGLWVRDSLGPWLHQVACRTAACARASAARRRRLERQAAAVAATSRPRPDHELERLLHEEIDRLPEPYRAPVVLCDIEGRTHEQAARHLGWPVGTVKSRLSRAHGRLRDRLTRRGLAPASGAFAPGVVVTGPGWVVPPALLESTTTIAVRFAGIGRAAVVRGSAASLAEGVLRAMSMTQWWKVATVLFVAGATASGVEWLGNGGGPPAPAQAPAAGQAKSLQAGDVPTRELAPDKLKHVVQARGSVEATRTADIYSQIEGNTTIIRLMPEGSKVKKGQVICELDSAALRDQLVNQAIKTKNAEANYLNARLTREVAEIAVREYVEGVYPQELAALKQEIDSDRAAIAKTEGRLDRTRKASQRIKDALADGGGARTPADILAELQIQDRLEDTEGLLEREKRVLVLAEARRKTLESYTRQKTIKELESAVKKARSDELAKQATWELEKGKEAKLAKLIQHCTMIAPIDGKIVLANDPARMFANSQPQIEEGATVRERQKILSIYNPDGPMQVNAKVHESDIASVKPSMPVRVRVDAFSDVTMPGVVLEVSPLPDPSNFFSQGVKVYTIRVRIDKPPVPLAPGLSAQADIDAGEQQNVLSVPLGAIVRYRDQDHAAVKMGDGRVEWRDVVLGISDGTNVEVKQGLKPGDKVILDPRPFLSDDQRAILKAEHDAARQRDAERDARIRELLRARGKTPSNR